MGEREGTVGQGKKEVKQQNFWPTVVVLVV